MIDLRTPLRILSAREALTRLNAVLPLAARQAALPAEMRALHRAILRGLALGDELPPFAELLARSGVADGSSALARFRSTDLVVIGDDGAITGAYPVTREETAHRVIVDGHPRFAMCAVDALAIGPMFGLTSRVDSRCHHCGAPVEFSQDDERIAPERLIDALHVGIAWQEASGCAAHSLCREMVFFCSAAHAASWQQRAPERNSVLSLSGAIRLAKEFFLPLLIDRS